MNSHINRHFLAYIELYLSAVGLILILTLPQVFFRTSLETWQAAAIIATIIGVLHGFIFWAIRRRQETLQRETIGEIREGLQEALRNQLSIMLVYAYLGAHSDNRDHALRQINDASDNIVALLDNLTPDMLQRRPVSTPPKV